MRLPLSAALVDNGTRVVSPIRFIVPISQLSAGVVVPTCLSDTGALRRAEPARGSGSPRLDSVAVRRLCWSTCTDNPAGVAHLSLGRARFEFAALRHRCDVITECSPLHSYIIDDSRSCWPATTPSRSAGQKKAVKRYQKKKKKNRVARRRRRNRRTPSHRRCLRPRRLQRSRSFPFGIHESPSPSRHSNGTPARASCMAGRAEDPKSRGKDDPRRTTASFVDQRGCGKSSPFFVPSRVKIKVRDGVEGHGRDEQRVASMAWELT